MCPCLLNTITMTRDETKRCPCSISLLTLSQVLSKLGKKDGRSGHINYRDSKLTRILKPSLSGNARMGCICCISPALQYVEESKSTLDFAMRTMLVTTNAKRCVSIEIAVVIQRCPILFHMHFFFLNKQHIMIKQQ